MHLPFNKRNNSYVGKIVGGGVHCWSQIYIFTLLPSLPLCVCIFAVRVNCSKLCIFDAIFALCVNTDWLWLKLEKKKILLTLSQFWPKLLLQQSIVIRREWGYTQYINVWIAILLCVATPHSAAARARTHIMFEIIPRRMGKL